MFTELFVCASFLLDQTQFDCSEGGSLEQGNEKSLRELCYV